MPEALAAAQALCERARLAGEDVDAIYICLVALAAMGVEEDSED